MRYAFLTKNIKKEYMLQVNGRKMWNYVSAIIDLFMCSFYGEILPYKFNHKMS